MTDHTREMLEEAWEHCAQTDKPFRRFSCAIIDERGTTNAGKFGLLLDAEAYLDAVMMLLPKWKVRGIQFNAPCTDDRSWNAQIRGGKEGGKHLTGFAPTPALALLAAIMKAKNDE